MIQDWGRIRKVHDIEEGLFQGPKGVYPKYGSGMSSHVREFRTQDSGQVYSTQNYTWKYYIRITLQNNTSMLNKYGPDIIKNAEMHVGRPLLRS